MRSTGTVAQTYEEDAVVDVAPLADRLLLFRSDFRVPHAVLPVTSAKARYASHTSPTRKTRRTC